MTHFETAKEPNGWTRFGLPGSRVMRALYFMRIEKTPRGWRAWDVINIQEVPHHVPETTHKTLRAAKEHCEKVLAIRKYTDDDNRTTTAATRGKGELCP